MAPRSVSRLPSSRRYAVQVLVLELLRDLRMLRNGHVFIKFSQVNGRPHDRLVQLQGAGRSSLPAIASAAQAARRVGRGARGRADGDARRRRPARRHI